MNSKRLETPSNMIKLKNPSEIIRFFSRLVSLWYFRFFQKVLDTDMKTYGHSHLNEIALSVPSQMPTEMPTAFADGEPSGNS